MREKPVEYGERPFAWDVESEKECTWYAYYEILKRTGYAPCYWDRKTKAGSYTNAKEWLGNFREPFEVKNANWRPTENDIVVWDGNYGHVAIVEKVEGDVVTLTEYNFPKKKEFNISTWNLNEQRSGLGKLLGFLHLPVNTVLPVERNKKVNQIRTTDNSLRIRTSPEELKDLSNVYSHVQIGYYNVLSKTKNGQHTWYEIAKGLYVADITTEYLPADKGESIVEKFREFVEEYTQDIEAKDEELTKYKDLMAKIHELTKEG